MRHFVWWCAKKERHTTKFAGQCFSRVVSHPLCVRIGGKCAEMLVTVGDRDPAAIVDAMVANNAAVMLDGDLHHLGIAFREGAPGCSSGGADGIDVRSVAKLRSVVIF